MCRSMFKVPVSEMRPLRLRERGWGKGERREDNLPLDGWFDILGIYSVFYPLSDPPVLKYNIFILRMEKFLNLSLFT